MRHKLKLYWMFLRLGIMNEMQYRVNFFVQLLQSSIAMVTGLAVLLLVFGHTETLGGWTQGELLAVMGVHILMGGLIGTFIEPNMGRIMEDIQQGTLDYALTKPEDSQLLVSVRASNIWRIVDVMIGLIVLIWALIQIQSQTSFLDAAAFVVALLMGGVMVYCVWLMVTTGAFWFIRMWNIFEVFQSMYQAGRWPIGIYPDWLRAGLTFLVPVGFAVTVPSEAIVGRLEWISLVIAFGFTLVLLYFARRVWMFGVKNYSGASA